jgi:hydrogenase expression/formation protein HypC
MMCLGVPFRIISVDGIAGLATDGTETQLIDLSLVAPVRPGEWVLTFLGAAREVITPDQAAQITSALNGLRSLMAGGTLGEAFADLESRKPALPPHLQAALEAGQTNG